MGYRSQVAIAIEKSKAEEFVKLAKNADEIAACGDYTVFCWKHVKWYQAYDDVEAMTSWLEENDDSRWQFIRIGEIGGDIDSYQSDAADEGNPWIWVTNPSITW